MFDVEQVRLTLGDYDANLDRWSMIVFFASYEYREESSKCLKLYY